MHSTLRKIVTFILLALPLAFASGQTTPNTSDEMAVRVSLALSTAEYPATPGDVMSVSYLSAAGSATVRFSIDADYSVDMGFFGTIDAEGMTYLELQQRVAELVRAVYSSSYPKIMLVSVGSFKVTIDGAVSSAGEANAWGLTRLSSAVSGRIHEFGNERSVTVRSAAGVRRTYDLFLAARDGTLTQNPYIRPGDKITVGASRRKVTLTGEVKRPGTYELLSGDTMYQLIERYGDGVTDYGDREKIVVTRYEAGSETPVSTITVDLNDGGGTFALTGADVVSVHSINELLPVVYLEGAVEDPSEGADDIRSEEVRDTQKTQRLRITLREGDTLYSVLSRSRERIRDDADLTRGIIGRATLAEPMVVDMEALLFQKRIDLDVDLTAGDRIVIPFGAVEVFLTGEVKSSAWLTVSPLTRLNQLVSDRLTEYSSNRDILIRSANGSEHRYDLFRAFRFGEQEHNPYLEPGDTIEVARASRRVAITGEIERPGTYTLQTGEHLGELISFYGGGFTTLADTEQVKITRYSGSNDAPASVIYIDANKATRYPIRDLDRIEVASSLRHLPVVYLDGAVAGGEKIRMQLKSGDTLYSILRSSQDRLSPSADLTKGFINREGRSAPIEVDMERLLYRYSDDLDVRLIEGDQIVVPYGNIEVFLKGEVDASRWITIEPLTRLNGLVAGHLTEYSSNRDITVRSETGDEKQYDLFRAARLGEKEQNPYLQVGDTIIVHRAERIVSISGEVERPGRYQLLAGENLTKLIEYYGRGFTTLADTKELRLTRYSADIETPSNIIRIDATTDEAARVELQNLDQISVASSMRYLPVVYLEGAVFIPADLKEDAQTDVEGDKTSSQRIRVTLRDGDTLYSVLRSSQSYLKPTADLTKGFINREGLSAPIEVDMERLLYQYAESLDFELEPGDQIVVPFGNIEVFLTGEVKASAWITIEPLTRLSRLVSGHLTEYSSIRNLLVRSKNDNTRVYDLFLASRLGEKEQDPYLRAGDTVTVRRVDRSVTISGQVERPGTYQPLPGENLVELIEYYGGGFTTLADQHEIRITRYTDDEATPSMVVSVDAATEEVNNTPLWNLDRIDVSTSLRRLPVVYLDGAVAGGTKIRMQLREGDSLYSVLQASKGSIVPNADLSKGFVSREGLSNPIEIDLERLLYRYDRSLDVALVEGDRIVIPYGNLEVFLRGEVDTSRWINIEPLTRLSKLVDGHLTEYSSTRDILVRSTNGDENMYDLFLASRLGEKAQDPYLESGDTVEVGRIERKVRLEGEVERPGTYQLLEGETLDDLIHFYGRGFTANADPAGVEIVSYETDGTSITRKQYIDLSENGEAPITIHHRDIVSIPSNLRLMPYVFFEGAVRPEEAGEEATVLEGSSQFRYRFHTGELLSESLENVSARLSPESDLENGYVLRASGKIENVNMEELLRREKGAKDLLLEPYDYVIIPFKQYFVIVAGGVKMPGRYPYIPNRTYQYYIDLAGGFDPNLHIGGAVNISDIADTRVRINSFIEPEMKINAPINNPLYYVNQLSGVLSVVGTIISILAITGVFGGG